MVTSSRARVVGFCVMGMLLIQFAWMLAVPPLSGIDEIDHTYRASSLSQGDLRPLGEFADPDEAWGDLVAVRSDVARAAHQPCLLVAYYGKANCTPVGAGPHADTSLVASSAARYNPVFYAIEGAAAEPFSGYDYVYAHIKRDVMLASMSGGTDIMGTFVSGCPLLPVWRGEIQCATLGMQVDVFDDEGRQLRGAKGELVCTAPFPSMPVGFWNDPGHAKYHAAYFEKYPNVWCHGDYVEITEHGGMIIYGRSDAVLNPGGVRIGTAEIYRQVEQLDEVVESLVIGQDWPLQNPTDVRVVLFVRLRDGLKLDDALIERIKQHIRANTTPRHVPAKVVQVADIPRTKSGKIVELAVRHVVHHRPVKNVEALANPEALELFRDRVELTT